jgi:hypothetical protein
MADTESRSNHGEDSLEDREETQLVCPECGGDEFGIAIRQVWFGPAIEYAGGIRDVEVQKPGHITGGDNSVLCTECETEWEFDELEGKAQ